MRQRLPLHVAELQSSLSRLKFPCELHAADVFSVEQTRWCACVCVWGGGGGVWGGGLGVCVCARARALDFVKVTTGCTPNVTIVQLHALATPVTLLRIECWAATLGERPQPRANFGGNFTKIKLWHLLVMRCCSTASIYARILLDMRLRYSDGRHV